MCVPCARYFVHVFIYCICTSRVLCIMSVLMLTGGLGVQPCQERGIER